MKTPRPIFYAYCDTVETPIRADRWMAQLGGNWMAVAPWERESDWFAETPTDGLPTPRVRSIDDVPTTGTLTYMKHDFTGVTFDTATGKSTLA